MDASEGCAGFGRATVPGRVRPAGRYVGRPGAVTPNWR